jgi:transcriptional regulator
MADERLELPQGTLDLLILKALALESLHGWAISERLQQISREALQVQQGSLYPALHRLERRGWIKAHWAVSENNRRAKYYELTRQGKKQLEVETLAWRKLAAAIGLVLDVAEVQRPALPAPCPVPPQSGGPRVGRGTAIPP